MIIKEYNIIIIGGGPNGLACAIEMQRKGMKALVLEKGAIAESILHYPRGMTFFSTSENIAIGDIPFTIDHPKATREEALNYYRMVVEYYDLPVRLFCKAETVEKQNAKFLITVDNGDIYQTDYVVIATGYFDFPRKLRIPGEDLPHVKYYYDEPFRYARMNVAIIGGGNSAVEAALNLYRHGVNVSLVVRKENMKKTAKYWLLPDLLNRIKEGSIKAYFNHETIRIECGKLLARNNPEKKNVEIPADFVFILAGYLPDTGFMRQAGVEIDPETLEPWFNPETFETNVPGLYVAGTVTAGIHTEKVFIENGRLHGKAIIEDIFSKVPESGKD